MDLDHERCYRAVAGRDERFDGVFFTAVRTTGIYCRPSCPAITPQRRNVTFYASAAAAQRAGYRACRRCRPDAVPGSPEWNARGDVVARVMRLVTDGAVERLGVAGVAASVGYSERQLNRLVTEELGAGVLAIARAQRAQTARILLETTDLPVTEVAWAAGFGSVRSFNDTVRGAYGVTPSLLRSGSGARGRVTTLRTTPAPAGHGPGGAVRRGRSTARRTPAGPEVADRPEDAAPTGPRRPEHAESGWRRSDGPASGESTRPPASVAKSACLVPEPPAGRPTAPPPIPVRLAARAPFDAGLVLAFLGARAVAGVEAWDGTTYRRTLSLPHGHATVAVSAAGSAAVQAEVRLADLRDLAPAVARVRMMLDLDADPPAIAEVLGEDPLLGRLLADRPGLRMPCCADATEALMRAIVGQQVSVAGARTVMGRIAAAAGPCLEWADDDLSRVFPDAERLAAVEPALLPMPRTRALTLRTVTGALADGTLRLDAGVDREQAVAALQMFRGIGPWTAGYVAMRGLGDPDVMLATDLGVRNAMAAAGGDGDPGAIEGRAQGWRPWRSYAVAHLWASAAGSSPPHVPPDRSPGETRTP